MRASLRSKLERLRTDYARITSQPFVHFYCPVLFKDEETELCQAHIINYAFPDSSRAWTVQRKDVDNFYGTNFEDDFLAIQYRIEGMSPGRVLTDRRLSRRIRPRILLDSEPVDYFFADEGVPERFTPLEYHSGGKSVQLGIKMLPADVAELTGDKWEIEIAKDVRLPALVSLIKAAHLTLFEMVGYRYALSAGGYFVGRQILGEFFCANHGQPKSRVREKALVFFPDFAHMARPVESDLDLEGTISDKTVFTCWGGRRFPWALIVFVKTSGVLHAVLIPVLDEPDAAAMFCGFLQDENDSIDVSWCRFEQDQWETSSEVRRALWPKTGVLYP